jgi:hypothetical protein
MAKKSKYCKLTHKTEAHKAVKLRVLSYWNQYGPNISKWPIAAEVFEQMEELMAPYGPDRNKRLAKLRTLYNRMTKQIFIDNGKSYFALFLSVVRSL